jgi:hypothetical protein
MKPPDPPILRSVALLAAVLCTTAAHAWEFSAQPICTLRHIEKETTVVLTHDPGRSEAYAIALTRPAPWPDAPTFAITFSGPRPLTITTGRHTLSEDGRTLTVRDRGFGNVLNGLEFNSAAEAIVTGAGAGSGKVLSLDGAAPEVRKFRACAQALST